MWPNIFDQEILLFHRRTNHTLSQYARSHIFQDSGHSWSHIQLFIPRQSTSYGSSNISTKTLPIGTVGIVSDQRHRTKLLTLVFRFLSGRSQLSTFSQVDKEYIFGTHHLRKGVQNKILISNNGISTLLFFLEVQATDSLLISVRFVHLYVDVDNYERHLEVLYIYFKNRVQSNEIVKKTH